MVEKQQQLYNLLKEIDVICRNNDIQYVLAGGTLIGAMRHRGFIPWDDDVDIMMTRDNWNKLKEAAKTQLPPNRALLAPELDSNYTNGFPRYMDTSVTAIHTHQIPGRDKAGEIIDIFILDPIPDDEDSYRQYVEEMMLYSDLVNDAAVFGGRWEINPWKYIKYKLTSLIRGKAYVLNKIEKKIFSYPEEQCQYYAMRWGGIPFRFEKRWYASVKLAPFEDILAMIPCATSEYLTWHYGDEWMYVPPVSERESHETVSSTEVDYQTIQREYLPRINRFHYEWNSTRRKIKGMSIAKRDHADSTYILELQAYNYKIRCEKKLSETGVCPADLTTELPVSTLADLFQEFFTFQLREKTIGREDWKNIYRYNHPVLVDLEPEFFYAAVHTLFYTNRIAKAYRLIEIWKKYHDVSERLAQIENSIQIYRKATNLFMDENDSYEAEKLVDSLLEIYPDHISILKLKLQICAATGKDNSKDIFVKCLDMWPEDGEFIKYQADWVLQNETIREAFPLYLSAYSKTKNGLIQLQITDVIKDYLPEILLIIENNFDCEIMKTLEKMFYNQKDALEKIYNFQIQQITDIHTLNAILSKMKKDGYYYNILKKIFLSLGVSKDAISWRLENIFGQNKTNELLNTVLSYAEHQLPENISASIWKLLGDLYDANGMEEQAISQYQLAACSELCELERYEIYQTVTRYLWMGDVKPIRRAFKSTTLFFKWYQDLYTIPDFEGKEDDEITTDSISVATRDT